MRVALPARVCTAALRRGDPAVPVARIAGEALGTGWQVRYAARAGLDAGRLRAVVEQRLARIVGEMSQWHPGSVLDQYNRSQAGSWTRLPPDFATVLAAALALAERSGGAFDPTLGRAAALLGYGAEKVHAPADPATLDAARGQGGWHRLAFDRAMRRVQQPGGLWLDLSGIGKGFAVDAVADCLRDEGAEDVLVEIGGELVGRGLRPDGQPWWVDLEAPPGVVLPPLRIGLHDLAVATSGDYVRGAHTLDPRTGRPLPPAVISVSVVHERAMEADGWATALTVLGVEQGMALAGELGLAARMVGTEGGQAREHLSPALQDMLG
ncbi:FAD:protein FMN transferase [Sphingomonas aracearum]|uniref:FAD:protein FMN transferase n=1 Tax=Sphingomonas aracearum TaxID=2283317 RepID=A0A369VU57_9SPHN|nr:FAD:protein FMN transferase [Sphingomonas aracearum]RDE05623.1 FAD:protein FMN transferase [Sphingomonas aracearum]